MPRWLRRIWALRAFRAGLYGCFGRGGTRCWSCWTRCSRPGLPVAAAPEPGPGHRRGWGSVYAALGGGTSTSRRSGRCCGAAAAGGAAGLRRGRQRLAPGRRGHQPRAGLPVPLPPPAPGGGDPVVPGWAYQWLVRLSPARDSWTAPVDVRRAWAAEEKPTAVAAEQLQALVAAPQRVTRRRSLGALRRRLRRLRLHRRPGRHPGGAAHPAAQQPPLLVRPRSGPQPRSGRPKRHGAKFVCDDPATWPAPTAELRVADEATARSTSAPGPGSTPP